jgi:hypothetical protein
MNIQLYPLAANVNQGMNKGDATLYHFKKKGSVPFSPNGFFTAKERFACEQEYLDSVNALPTLRTSYYFCACSDLSLLYEAYDFSS